MPKMAESVNRSPARGANRFARAGGAQAVRTLPDCGQSAPDLLPDTRATCAPDEEMAAATFPSL
ncbi:MAG: hypothetical protein PF443_06525 [Allgaiera sp.]|jgi:hypothetical protein|nr:hypothetical protein [Allgaiera sp.]